MIIRFSNVGTGMGWIRVKLLYIGRQEIWLSNALLRSISTKKLMLTSPDGRREMLGLNASCLGQGFPTSPPSPDLLFPHPACYCRLCRRSPTFPPGNASGSGPPALPLRIRCSERRDWVRWCWSSRRETCVCAREQNQEKRFKPDAREQARARPRRVGGQRREDYWMTRILPIDNVVLTM